MSIVLSLLHFKLNCGRSYNEIYTTSPEICCLTTLHLFMVHCTSGLLTQQSHNDKAAIKTYKLQDAFLLLAHYVPNVAKMSI